MVASGACLQQARKRGLARHVLHLSRVGPGRPVPKRCIMFASKQTIHAGAAWQASHNEQHIAARLETLRSKFEECGRAVEAWEARLLQPALVAFPFELSQPTIQPKRRNRRAGVPLAEAEIRVRQWLLKHGKKNPAAITRDAIAAGTGLSAGQVSRTAAWKAFRQRRDTEKTGRTVRATSLTDRMLAVTPAAVQTPDELASLNEEQQAAEQLAALIKEQQADEAEQNRRHKRRHAPS